MSDQETIPAEFSELTTVPVLPLRDVVVYPNMVIPLFVGRDKSIQALDAAMTNNKQILLVAQKSAELDEPGFEDFYNIGTLSSILQLLKLPDGTIKVLVEGSERARVNRYAEESEYFTAEISVLKDSDETDEKKLDVLSRSIVGLF